MLAALQQLAGVRGQTQLQPERGPRDLRRDYESCTVHVRVRASCISSPEVVKVSRSQQSVCVTHCPQTRTGREPEPAERVPNSSEIQCRPRGDERKAAVDTHSMQEPVPACQRSE